MKQAIDRLKPGRKEKPVKEKVSQVAFYIPTKFIEVFGEQEIKAIALRAIADKLANKGLQLVHKLLKD